MVATENCDPYACKNEAGIPGEPQILFGRFKAADRILRSGNLSGMTQVTAFDQPRKSLVVIPKANSRSSSTAKSHSGPPKSWA